MVIHLNVINQFIFSTEIAVQDISSDRYNASAGAMHIQSTKPSRFNPTVIHSGTSSQTTLRGIHRARFSFSSAFTPFPFPFPFKSGGGMTNCCSNILTFRDGRPVESNIFTASLDVSLSGRNGYTVHLSVSLQHIAQVFPPQVAYHE